MHLNANRLYANKVAERCIKNAIKAPHWYVVQGSDTTIMPIAAFLFGQ